MEKACDTTERSDNNSNTAASDDSPPAYAASTAVDTGDDARTVIEPRIQDGHTHVRNILIVGDEGLGKSTLLRALIEGWVASSVESRNELDDLAKLRLQLESVRSGETGDSGTKGILQYPGVPDGAKYKPKQLNPHGNVFVGGDDTKYFEFYREGREGYMELHKIALLDAEGFQFGPKHSVESNIEWIRSFLKKRIQDSGVNAPGSPGCQRIHAIIYLMRPHRITTSDVQIMKMLQDDRPLKEGVEDPPGLSLIFPVVAKSDSMTANERVQFRDQVRAELLRECPGMIWSPRTPEKKHNPFCIVANNETEDVMRERLRRIEHDKTLNDEERQQQKRWGPSRNYEWGPCFTRRREHSDLQDLSDHLFAPEFREHISRMMYNIDHNLNTAAANRMKRKNRALLQYGLMMGVLVAAVALILYSFIMPSPKLIGHSFQDCLDVSFVDRPVRKIFTPYQSGSWAPPETDVFVTMGACTRLRFDIHENCSAAMLVGPLPHQTKIGLVAGEESTEIVDSSQNIRIHHNEDLLIYPESDVTQQMFFDVCEQSYMINLQPLPYSEREALVRRADVFRVNVAIDTHTDENSDDNMLIAMNPIEPLLFVLPPKKVHAIGVNPRKATEKYTFEMNVRVSHGLLLINDGTCTLQECVSSSQIESGLQIHLSGNQIGLKSLDDVWSRLRYAQFNYSTRSSVDLSYTLTIFDGSGYRAYLTDTVMLQVKLPPTHAERLLMQIDALNRRLANENITAMTRFSAGQELLDKCKLNISHCETKSAQEASIALAVLNEKRKELNDTKRDLLVCERDCNSYCQDTLKHVHECRDQLQQVNEFLSACQSTKRHCQDTAKRCNSSLTQCEAEAQECDKANKDLSRAAKADLDRCNRECDVKISTAISKYWF